MTILAFVLMLGIGGYCSWTDCSTGIVKNKVLLCGASAGVVMDCFYYGFVHPELLIGFLENLGMVALISLCLYGAKIWAGGDSKLVFVLALLYPGDLYFTYAGQIITLPFVFITAFILGYLYLAAASFKNIKTMNLRSFLGSLFSFVKNYISVLIWIYAVEIWIFPHIQLPWMILLVIFFGISWGISRWKFLAEHAWINWIVLALDVLGVIVTKRMPYMDWRMYLLILAITAVRLLMHSTYYETIPVSEIKKGMILSTASTMNFQRSRVKGLPEISREDLSSRLTEAEADSIHRWEHSAHGVPELTIVRKVPFAFCIALSFLIYFLIWSLS